jgi:Mor family transcriptional regulator
MAEIPQWAQEVTIKDLPPQLRRLADVIGVDATIKCAQALGGTYHYIPKLDALIRDLRDARIREEWNYKNVKELALKYDLSVVQIYAILKGKAALPGQGNMFEELETAESR